MTCQFDAGLESDVRHRLTMLCSKLLDSGDLPLDVPLRDIGLNSLSRVRLLAKIIQEFGVNPLNAGYANADTLEMLAVKIVQLLVNPRPAPPKDQFTAGELPALGNRFGYFFRREVDFLFWWISTPVLIANASIDSTKLEAAVRCLLNHHEGLRMRLVESRGQVRQQITDVQMMSPLYITQSEAAVGSPAFKRDVEAEVLRLKRTQQFGDDLFRVVSIGSSDGGCAIVVLCHHLLTDAYSFPILVSDLFLAYSQIEAGTEPRLPSRTMSVREHAKTYMEYGRHLTEADALYWQHQFAEYPASDKVATDEDNEEFSSQVTRSLAMPSGSNWQDLTSTVVLAVGRAYLEWQQQPLSLGLLTHGRDPATGFDLSRTIGYLVEIVPIGIDSATRLQHIDAQIEYARSKGWHFAYLKYLTTAQLLVEIMMRVPTPSVSLNILPSTQPEFDCRGFVTPSFEYSLGPNTSPSTKRVFRLSGGAWVCGDRIYIAWDYSAKRYQQSAVERFTDRCAALLSSLMSRAIP